MYFSISPSPERTSYTTMPMDIPSKQYAQSASQCCAFPSWPRRSSLSGSEKEGSGYASSYISDDDLEDMFGVNVFDEQETPQTSPNMTPEQQVVVDTGAIREFIAQEKAKKERKARRSSAGLKKPRRGTAESNHMSVIRE